MKHWSRILDLEFPLTSKSNSPSGADINIIMAFCHSSWAYRTSYDEKLCT